MASPQPTPPFAPEPQATGTTGPIRRNVRAVADIAKRSARSRSAFAHFTDRVTNAAGTTGALMLHGIVFAAWITLNILLPRPFDPFPFSILTCSVALEAIFLTLFVVGSQIRLAHDSDQRAQIDLQVTLLAEQEMTLVLRMLRDLCERSNVALPEGLTELLCDVDIEEVAATVAREVPTPHGAGQGGDVDR